MMKFVLPAAVALSFAVTAGAAHAQQAMMQPSPPTFYATPMNMGAPENLPGESIIPGMGLAMHTVNTVTQPILQPMLAPGAAGPGAEQTAMNEPMHEHHMMSHHHMMMHHKTMMMHHKGMMMHHKAMMKKSM